MARIKAYFRLDLYFFENPKVVDLSHAATVLYIASIAYANRRETDGYVAQPMLRRLVELDDYGDGPSHHMLAEELVKAGLWEPVEGGWEIHDFLEHNESSQERDSRRADEAARKRRERDKAKERPDGPEPPSNPPSGNVRPDTSGRPEGPNVPSGPIEVEVTEQSDSRGKVNTVVALAAPARPDSEDIRAVFDAWKATLPSGSRPRLTEARRDAVKAALTRYDREDVEDAARGWVNDPWPERAQQNDLAQLLHMGSKRKPVNILERMRDYARNGRPVVLGKHTTQMLSTHQALRNWAEQQEGGDSDDPHGVDRDRGQAQRELPGPAG
jgi:hypothetical protein